LQGQVSAPAPVRVSPCSSVFVRVN